MISHSSGEKITVFKKNLYCYALCSSELCVPVEEIRFFHLNTGNLWQRFFNEQLDY